MSRKSLSRRALINPRLTAVDLAKAAGGSFYTLRSYANGRRQIPDKVLKRLARFLRPPWRTDDQAFRGHRADAGALLTLAVNLVGSFALGVFFAFHDRTLLLGPDLWFFLGTGLCGGFTTMSTFSLETLTLLRQREVYYALELREGTR